MYINVSEEVEKLSEIFSKNNEKLYIVGGYIRDSIMEKFSMEHNDLDLCSSAKPEKIEKMLKDTEFTIDNTNAKYGTTIIFGKKRYEHTTFRRENYNLNGEHNPTGVEFIKDLKTDSLRRDFTINSIYFDIERRELVDPAGGIEDIKNKKIRCTNNPRRAFREDGERILRLVRFACTFNFDIEEKVIIEALENGSSIINLSKDRIRKELNKMLVCDTFYPNNKESEYAHAKCMIMLAQLDLWKYIFPAIDKLYNTQMTDDKDEQLFEHMVNVLSVCAPNSRLACMFHDVGKLYTKENNQNFEFNHDWADLIIEKNLGQEGLMYSKKEIENTKKIVKGLDFDKFGLARKSTIRRFIKDNYDVFYDICDLKDAISLENTKFNKKSSVIKRWKKVYNQMKEEGAPIDVDQLNIDGNEILKYIPNIRREKIGNLLNIILDFCLIHPTCNEKKYLINYAKKIAKKRELEYFE